MEEGDELNMESNTLGKMEDPREREGKGWLASRPLAGMEGRRRDRRRWMVGESTKEL